MSTTIAANRKVAQLALVLGAGTCMAVQMLCRVLGIERTGAAVPTQEAPCLPPVPVTVVALAALLLGERLGPVPWLGAVMLRGSIWGPSRRFGSVVA